MDEIHPEGLASAAEPAFLKPHVIDHEGPVLDAILARGPSCQQLRAASRAHPEQTVHSLTRP